MGHERACSASKPTRQTAIGPHLTLWESLPQWPGIDKNNPSNSLSSIAMSHSIILCLAITHQHNGSPIFQLCGSPFILVYNLTLILCMMEEFMVAHQDKTQKAFSLFSSFFHCLLFCSFFLSIFPWIHIIGEVTDG